MSKKRILSLFLALVLCLSLLPAAALASDEPEVEAAEAVELAEEDISFDDEAAEAVEPEDDAAPEEAIELAEAEETEAEEVDEAEPEAEIETLTEEAEPVAEAEPPAEEAEPVAAEEPILAEEAIPEIAVADEAAQAAEGVPISESNFPDENFRSYVRESFDLDDDGYLSPQEIAAVTEIRCGRREIYSLSGIEFFTALTSLACGDNNLSSLDLSKNTELRNLVCYFNNLQALDLSANTKLDILECYHNSLQELDLSANTALTTVICSHNRLTKLNVSGCILIEDLWCEENQLTELDISTNTKLVFLSCGENMLTTLDTNNNPDLEVLYCYTNQLSSLNLTNNTALNRLYCFDNQLQELDVSNCPNLGTLHCYGNEIQMLDIQKCAIRNNLESSRTEDGVTRYYSYCYEVENLELAHDASTQLIIGSVSKPLILEEPSDRTASAGSKVTFEFTVRGTGLSYQWQYKTSAGKWASITSSAYTGAKTASMTVTATTARNGMEFRCKVTNSAGSVYTNAVTLTVTAAKPTIKTQPTNQSVSSGSKATFKVEAGGSDLTYQWQYKTSAGKWANITSSTYTGIKTATMKVSATSGRDGMQYRCKITNSAGSVYSNPATLLVKPVIQTQPTSQTVSVGSKTTFKVVAGGSDLTYQWQYKTSAGKWASITSSAYTGAKTASMTVTATTARNGMEFRCKVSNSAGTVYSNAVTLTVTEKPTIQTQPKSQTVDEGSKATFKVVAGGSGLTYQWQYKTSAGKWASITSSAYAGRKTATMKVTATIGRSGLQLRCKVSNSAGTVYSNAVTLTVNASAPEDSDGYISCADAYTQLNAMRSQEGIWYWDEDDTSKVVFNTNDSNRLSVLQRNEEMEETAKVRAKELAESFSHTRPDGTMCFTAYPSVWAAGENIAAGQTSVTMVITDWAEENEAYEYQGHRRNMLDPGFNVVGIACYQHNGVNYWAMCLGTM